MYWPRKLTRDINIRVPPYAIIYQQRRRDLINITSYMITIRFYICVLSSSSEQSTLRVFLTYSPRSNTTPSITLLGFEFTTGNMESVLEGERILLGFLAVVEGELRLLFL